jgi:predicted hydrocarbon binding protein
MARIKGTNLVHTRSFVESGFGADGWSAVLAAMPAESRAAVGSILAVGWYPAHLHVEMVHAIERALGPTRPDILRDAGAYSADFDVTRIHRILFRFANPGFILEKVAEIWGRFYETGHWTLERPSPTAVVATLRDFEIVDAPYCAFMAGYYVRLFELVGAKDVQVAHRACRARGDEACVFEGSWR